MTTHTKRFIETSDILAMRFECRCGASVTVPLASFQSIPTVCPNCSEQFCGYSDRSVQDVFAVLVTSLRQTQKAADTRKFKFSLELGPEAMQSVSQKLEPER